MCEKVGRQGHTLISLVRPLPHSPGWQVGPASLCSPAPTSSSTLKCEEPAAVIISLTAGA